MEELTREEMRQLVRSLQRQKIDLQQNIVEYAVDPETGANDQDEVERLNKAANERIEDLSARIDHYQNAIQNWKHWANF